MLKALAVSVGPRRSMWLNARTCTDLLAILGQSDELKGTGLTQQSEQKLGGITLLHQASGNKVHLPHKEKIVLGRTRDGSEYFRAVPSVSRVHASIEVIDGYYVISDLGSSNGTFIGAKKVDCRKHQKQRLIDGEHLYLGNEDFIIRIHRESLPQVFGEAEDTEISDGGPSTAIGRVAIRSKER